MLHYRHKFEHVANDSKLPTSVTDNVIAEANAEELRQSQCFLSWNGAITIHSLRSDFWVTALGAVAEQESDIASRRAEAAMRANYQDYLNGGPALGLGRQHRMSRTAVGWVPTKVDSSKLLAVDDFDDTGSVLSDGAHQALEAAASTFSSIPEAFEVVRNFRNNLSQRQGKGSPAMAAKGRGIGRGGDSKGRGGKGVRETIA